MFIRIENYFNKKNLYPGWIAPVKDSDTRYYIHNNRVPLMANVTGQISFRIYRNYNGISGVANISWSYNHSEWKMDVDRCSSKTFTEPKPSEIKSSEILWNLVISPEGLLLYWNKAKVLYFGYNMTSKCSQKFDETVFRGITFYHHDTATKMYNHDTLIGKLLL